MPFDALSAKASEIVPVGAMESRCELRMPCLRMRALSASGRRLAQCGSAKYLSASNSGNGSFSMASSTDASYAASRMAREICAAIARPSSELYLSFIMIRASPKPVKPSPTRRLACASLYCSSNGQTVKSNTLSNMRIDNAVTRAKDSKSKDGCVPNGSRTKAHRLIEPRSQQP